MTNSALALPATLTMGEASATLASLSPAARAGGEGALVVDAGALQSFDSSAIATLLELRRMGGGRALAVRGAPKTMVELAGLYGVAELLGFEAPRG